jgi:hypothetical protein
VALESDLWLAMEFPNDDETAQVDSTFLGPKGWLLPFRARYSAYGIGLALAVVMLSIERRLGIQPGIWSVVYTLSFVITLTRIIGHAISYEVPFRAAVVIFMHELDSPRPRSDDVKVSLRPGRVRNSWHGKVTLR